MEVMRWDKAVISSIARCKKSSLMELVKGCIGQDLKGGVWGKPSSWRCKREGRRKRLDRDSIGKSLDAKRLALMQRCVSLENWLRGSSDEAIASLNSLSQPAVVTLALVASSSSILVRSTPNVIQRMLCPFSRTRRKTYLSDSLPSASVKAYTKLCTFLVSAGQREIACASS